MDSIENLKEIELVFENCDTIRIKAEDISLMRIYHVSKYRDFCFYGVKEDEKADINSTKVYKAREAHLILKKSADKEHIEFGIGNIEGKSTVFKRILAWNDIAAISLIHNKPTEEKGSETYVYMPWEGEDEDDIKNKLLEITFQKDGSLDLVFHREMRK